MPSFDNLYDMLSLLDYEGFRYVILTAHIDKSSGEPNFNLDHFVNLKTKKEKQIMTVVGTKSVTVE